MATERVNNVPVLSNPSTSDVGNDQSSPEGEQNPAELIGKWALRNSISQAAVSDLLFTLKELPGFTLLSSSEAQPLFQQTAQSSVPADSLSVREEEYTDAKEDDLENRNLSDEASDIEHVSEHTESTESESEDNEEPKFKYKRMLNDFIKILDEECVSCVAVHSKFLCVGSSGGRIYILDPLGNNVTISPKKYYEAHTVAVNQISIDESGDFFASCSDDGNVNIYNFCDPEKVESLVLNSKIRCVAIDPEYRKGGIYKRFIIAGDESVTVYKQDIDSRFKSNILQEGGLHSDVSNLKWYDRFVAWNWKSEVRIYDMTDMVAISRILFDSLTSDNAFSNRCNLFWKDSQTLFIGWGNEIQVYNVRKQEDPIKIKELGFNYYGQIMNKFKTDFYICGISSFGNFLTVLCLDINSTTEIDEKQKQEETKSERNGNTTGTRSTPLDMLHCPKFHIIQPRQFTYEIMDSAVFQTRDYQQHHNLCDYHLESLKDEVHYFIVTPKDIICTESRDMDDHIQWIIEHDENYEDAWKCADRNINLLERHSAVDIGMKYLDHLINHNRFEDAGRLCSQIIGRENAEEWGKQIVKFNDLGQLRAIVPFIPKNETDELYQYYYEFVLLEYLKVDLEGFQLLVRDWALPRMHYNVETIISAVSERLQNRHLLRALADLYFYHNKHKKALGIYIKLKDPYAFVYIEENSLFNEILDKIEMLLTINTQEALAFFIKNKHHIEPKVVVENLQKNRKYLCQYLDALYKTEKMEMLPEFHRQLISLYAENEPDLLLIFLKSSTKYSIDEAKLICQAHHLCPELNYLLTLKEERIVSDGRSFRNHFQHYIGIL